MNEGHPKGLYVLFYTEMWERFSYYGMRAILVLYMTQALLFDVAKASTIYGNFTGLAYLMPLAGGYIADRWWGNRRSILVGGGIMSLGQFLMFLSASNYADPALAHPLLWAGLGVIIAGTGLFKANIASMVGSLYAPQDGRKDSAFTIFYMGINIGAFLAPLVAGGLGDTGNPADFRWGFLSASVGMALGTIIFQIFKNKHIVDAEGHPLGLPPAERVRGADKGDGSPLAREDWERVAVIFILSFFVIFFWAAFEQAGASLTVFADRQTDRVILGWTMPASWFQSVNAVAIVLFAPVFAGLWSFLGRHKLDPSTPVKMSFGFFLLAIGYLVIAFGVKGVDPTTKVSMMWLISLYLLHTFGELCLSPIGLSAVSKLSPARFASLMMGVWYLASSLANKMAGVLSSFYPEKGKEPPVIMGYEVVDLHSFFLIFVFMSVAAGVLLFFLARPISRWSHGRA
ncbi:MFS transporter [bacterium DOLJORAL78_65_58]|nr:MAG: MFS transporter [bacterium DOLZORAL124_64_63]PIE75714.1 MAG: MFS transporter [bacterium DOLJORAL78_65_58]